jgi:hypothetical protein
MKGAPGVAAALTVLTLGMTWPLGARVTTSIPGDYGDPLVAIWAMGWVMATLTRALAQPSALAGFWDANVFFPEPQALAFSEPYVGQAVLVLPFYWLTGNLIFCYNAAVLLTFVLSGLGGFLLVRSLADSRLPDGSTGGAALVGGIAAAVTMAFTYARLRSHVSHLELLSIHWLPFALFGVHRYLVADSRRALALGAAAFAALNASSLEYMAYSALVAVPFVLAEIVRLKRWQLRVWLELWAAAAFVTVVSLPLLLPHSEIARRLGIVRRAPDLLARPAFTMLVLFVAAVLAGIVAARLASRWRRPGAAGVLVALAIYLLAVRPSIFPLDRAIASPDFAAPPPSLTPAPELPRIYRDVHSLTSDAVLLELPFGDPWYDRRYMFFAAMHGRRLVNGYGAIFPPSYLARQRVLANPLLDPERTAQAISIATHVAVHGAAWPDRTRTAIVRQLESLGGTLVARDGDSVLYQMRPTERLAQRLNE